MATTPPVEFEKATPNPNDPLMEGILHNVSSFAGGVSELLENLTNFFTLTKFYLQAIKDPLALVLIPALDALISALEDLKNIGFGTLSVWPWEVGKLESGVDTTKLEEALTLLSATLQDIDPKLLKFDPVAGKHKVVSEEEDFDFTPFSNISDIQRYESENVIVPPKFKNHPKWSILNMLDQLQNFLYPSKWGYGQNAAGQFIKTLNESFKFRTLTPTQFVDEVNSSFSDVNDNRRPVGSGEYLAFVIFFALPTHHALRDVTQSFVDFFAGLVEDSIPDTNDDRVDILELGDPLVVEGLQRDLELADGTAINALQKDIDRLKSEQNKDVEDLINLEGSLAGVERSLNKILKMALEENEKNYDRIVELNTMETAIDQDIDKVDRQINTDQFMGASTEKINSLHTRKNELLEAKRTVLIDRDKVSKNSESNQRRIDTILSGKIEAQTKGEIREKNFEIVNATIRMNEALEEQRQINEHGALLEEKLYGFTETVKRKIPSNLTHKFVGNKDNDWKPSHTINVGAGPHSRTMTVTIPMFPPKTLIQQGTVFNDFTAEVIEHEPIEIVNGKIISNRVRVKSKRGDIVLNTSEGDKPNTPPVIALNPKGIPEEDGSLGTFGVLKTGTGFQGSRLLLEYPMFSGPISTAPSMTPSNDFIATILSNNTLLSEVLPATPWIKRIILTKNIFDDPDTYTPRFRKIMVEFYESLSIGQPIMHDFILSAPTDDPSAIEKSPGTIDADFGFRRALWSLIPGFGYQPCIKSVRIDGKEMERVDIESQLFESTKDSAGVKVYTRMKPVFIEIGRMVKEGEIDSYSTDRIKVPGGKQSYQDHNNKSFKVYTIKGGRNTLPNWKFTRIQDIFPVYGETIDRIIDKIEFAKSLAEGALKGLNDSIKWLEDQIEALSKLNKAIQNVLLFFTKGIGNTGVYSAKFSGRDGVAGFKKKLSSAKIKQVSFEPQKEFDLVPVTTTQRVRNPSTGEWEDIESTTLKFTETTPTDEEFEDMKNEDGEVVKLLSFSDLDALKYSGGMVFYAQGNDIKLLDKFLKLSGIKKREEVDETGIPSVNLSSFLDVLRPFVKRIEVQKVGTSTFINAEGATDISRISPIKIVFANDTDTLTEDEKQEIKDARGEDFEFGVDIQQGSILPNINVNVSSANFETNEPLNNNVELVSDDVANEQSFIIRPSITLASSTNYKISVKKTVVRGDGTILEDDFQSTLGFTTGRTSSLLTII